MTDLTVGSVCSGIGGLDLGFGDGYRTAWMCEKDAACRKILARHFPGVPLYDNLETIHGQGVCGGRCANCAPAVDVLIGGTPCQSFSLAGRREGMAGESGLFVHFARLAFEIAPRWLVWENVPGVLSLDGGEVFADILEMVTGTRPVVPNDGWRSAGFGRGARRSAAWRVLDAQHLGVPQRRRRVFLVGHLGNPWPASASVLFEPDSGPGDPAESAEEGEDDADSVGDSVASDGRNRQRDGEIVSALTASDGGVDFDTAEAGHLIPLEACVVGDGWGNERARTLTSPGRGPHYDLDTENFVVDQAAAFNQRDEARLSDVAYAVQSQPGVDEQLVQTVSYRKARRAHTDDDHETWVEDDVANTLNVNDIGDQRTTAAIVEPIPIELRMATRTSGATGAGTPGTGFGQSGDPSYPVMASPPPAAQQDLIVRRLTPLECERLQGLPDGWTDGQADTTRYRQLGNAVAVPCATWIGRRLREFT